MIQLQIPGHVHLPNPAWVSELEGKRVFLDVGVALRAALWPESYSRKVLEHIERTKKGVAVFSPHVRDEGLKVLGGVAPAARPAFLSYLRRLTERKVAEEKPNGDPGSLQDWKSLGVDDDIVIASALAAGCDVLVTLDEPLAKQAANKIKVLAPAELEWSQMQMVKDNAEAAIFPKLSFASDKGTIIFQILPQDGSTGYVKKGGRRYVFSTDQGFACWLSEESWAYQFGYMDSFGSVVEIPLQARGNEVRVGLTYNLATRECTVGAAIEGQPPVTAAIKKQSLPRASIGKNMHLLGSPKGQQFSGYWQGALSSVEHQGVASFKFAVQHASFFSPLDHLRYRIEDAMFGQTRLLVPEAKLIA
jgi:predicted nucleic acid-binding protein